MLALFFLGLVLTLHPLSAAGPAPQQGRNVIEGYVSGSDGQPIQNARVFLQDDSYSHLASTYTDGSGRFRFNGLQSAAYNVLVEPVGTDYERQTQRVEARPFGAGRNAYEIFRVSFQLKLKKNAAGSRPAVVAVPDATVFYQEVPEAAKREFERGQKSLQKGDFDATLKSLTSALEIFPDYYDAMELLATEHLKRQEFRSALPLLERAVQVNKSGWRGFYSLGIALMGVDRDGEAVAPLRRAVELNPRSPNTQMRLGMALANAEATRPEAIETFKKVLALDDKNIPAAHLYLSRLLDLNGQLAPAIESMKNYVRLAPRDDPQLPQALLYLAQMYDRNKQFVEAADAVEASLRAAPQTAQREKLTRLAEQLRQRAAQPQKSQ